ncbi:helix-turn-helix transcriptional regulator [Saccharibacillus sp. VR-M41]|uniref:Helix-turn-helix transcriptional regulator n=2 Tax=Saccharibacillus alkalitolerans TaxID=2705290 RepID=A0ABX0F9H8_9BACL|nr:helix-turn-helix transcriptional regulator [Saccharibacillus alkalitolerans]
MNTLNFSTNVIRLRHQKKITQEQLAEFIGVTKASVSKWENKQSMPDILILPVLAAFFDVTIDELLGYEPQLSREQIQKIYRDLAADFAERPFEDVMTHTQELIKKYYSCYPFLFQMCVLRLNHFMLAEDQDRQAEILASVSDLCGRIIADCRDIGLSNDAVILKASADMQLGKTREVIETLEEMLSPLRLSNQSDSLLIQAYRIAGQTEKADSFTQIGMFTNLLSLIGGATQHLAIHGGDLAVCEETMSRADQVLEAYRLESLHPNAAALLHLQGAIAYAMHGKKKEAVGRLTRYASCAARLSDREPKLTGDRYFNAVEPWFDQLDLGSSAPRDKKVILESALQALSHPAFAVLQDDAGYLGIRASLAERSRT